MSKNGSAENGSTENGWSKEQLEHLKDQTNNIKLIAAYLRIFSGNFLYTRDMHRKSGFGYSGHTHRVWFLILGTCTESLVWILGTCREGLVWILGTCTESLVMFTRGMLRWSGYVYSGDVEMVWFW